MRIAVLALLGVAACGAPQEKVEHVTVPLVVEGNRPFVELTFRTATGPKRSARFLVDSGGGGFLLAEPLAREIGLMWGETMQEEGEKLARAKAAPDAYLGEMALDLDGNRVIVVLGKSNLLPPVAPGHAEGLFPGHLLARYHVVFDYPGGKFTLARHGTWKPKGTALPMPVSKSSGFPRTEVEIDGVARGFLIDTGASFTMVSEVLLKSLGSAHPDWARQAGAVGDARTLGGSALETLFVPEARWGENRLKDLGVVSQREGTFERYMSRMMTAPIVGSLAGNVLKDFRVELDYANEKLYLSKP